MSDTDLELDEESVLEDNTFNAAYSAFDTRLLDAMHTDAEKARSLTTNEFLREAYIAAGTIVHVAGDADGFVGEQATTVRQNIATALLQVNRQPEEFVISAIAAEPDIESRIAKISRVIEQLQKHADALTDLAKKGIFNA